MSGVLVSKRFPKIDSFLSTSSTTSTGTYHPTIAPLIYSHSMEGEPEGAKEETLEGLRELHKECTGYGDGDWLTRLEGRAGKGGVWPGEHS